ncbi:hypothetical protein [Streptomyces hainanensis]|uniref:Uncharacterized protein n=1 Tax=Streptomyces hainanensis TaxID=402648 RepID=A0A4R4TEN3_9ACTN|nr:hypothetical protein [Streptomyces hainanensis]TDC74054.1 hypothetical protein E1283_17080 [Streptomyces hainanensis]
MNADRMLAAAAADFDRLLAVLGADEAARLRRHLTVMRAEPPGSDRRRQAAESAARVVGPLLGSEAGGRYAEAVDSGGGFRPEDLAVLLIDGHRMVGPVLGPVRDRLLATPMLDDEFAERWEAQQAFIRLPGPGGGERLPLFQFAPSAPAAPSAPPEPRPVVLEVNLLLDARRDPWGAADWWLSPNAWLGTGRTSPAHLLGTQDAALLPDLARHLTSEEGI